MSTPIGILHSGQRGESFANNPNRASDECMESWKTQKETVKGTRFTPTNLEKNEFSLPFRELEKDNAETETLHRKPKTETNW